MPSKLELVIYQRMDGRVTEILIGLMQNEVPSPVFVILFSISDTHLAIVGRETAGYRLHF